MSYEERGPSWWDVGAYAEEIERRWNCSVSLSLGRPVGRIDGKGNSGWSACAGVRRRIKGQERDVGEQIRFGAGGSYKTAPAAFHAALRSIEAKLEEAERSARSQAAF